MPEDSLLDEKIKSQWIEIKENIRKECGLSQIVYGTWIEPLIFERYESETAYIVIPHNNSMAIEYINKRFTAFFIVAISEVIGSDSLQVRYIMPDDVENIATQEKRNEERRIQQGARLKSKFTFESFVVGDSNRFAYSAAVAVAEDPGNAYNPLFLYGGPGLGKTHLLQAIGNYILHNTPEKTVLYVTSEEFTNEVVDHIMKGVPEKLRDKYRNVDVLMVDDVQFIIGKNSTQLEFFHTFNSLYQEGKQIVLSSDRHPKEIENLDERIRSRFEMGLTSDIQTPDYETRMAILRRLQEGSPIKIDDNVLEYIATGVVSNVRELEGAFTKIVAYSRLNKLRDARTNFQEKIIQNEVIENNRPNPIPKTKDTLPVLVRQKDGSDEIFEVKKSDIFGQQKSSANVTDDPAPDNLYEEEEELDEPEQNLDDFEDSYSLDDCLNTSDDVREAEKLARKRSQNSPNLWKHDDVPHTGWNCVGVEDLGAPVGICEMCGYQIIRYAHHMKHPLYRSLTCGCICAGKMEGSIENARQREAQFKNLQARRINFFKRKWKRSKKGNDYLKVDGRIIVIYNLASGKRWKYSIDSEFSKLTYDTKTNAMAAAFDQMEILRAHE